MAKTKKNSKSVKATNPKMVPESKAVEVLQEFVMKVIMGNRKTRPATVTITQTKTISFN